MKKLITTAGIVLFGNLLYAYAVTVWVAPAGLVLGGFTGLSIALHHFVSIPVSWMVLGFHLLTFIAGSAVLGRHFAVSTAAGTFIYPLCLQLFEWLFRKAELPHVRSLLLTAVIAAVLIGLSLGLMTRAGTSTGGTEVIPLLINKLTGKSVGGFLLLLDGLIMVVQMVYAAPVQILYGIGMVVLYSGIVHILNIRRKGR